MIKITYNKEKVSYEEVNKPFQSRGTSVYQLFTEAWASFPKNELPEENRCIYIDLEDRATRHGENVYHISDTKANIHKCFPCFLFDHWKEVHIEDFTETIEQIRKIGEIQPQPSIDKLFWIGANTNAYRSRLVDIGRQNPDRIHAIMMSWPEGPFVSIMDHTKYKYLIDLEGIGYSARTKVLAHCKRLLFIQDRAHWDWSMVDIKPWVHYVPVRNDLSDLVKHIAWADANPKEVALIIQNMDAYAMSYCTRERAIQHIQNLILTQSRFL